jgi:hypothetical protein
VYSQQDINFTVIECKNAFKEYTLVEIKIQRCDDLNMCAILKIPNSDSENNQLLLDLIKDVSAMAG